MTAAGYQPCDSVSPKTSTLPAHLRGSRAAIFHLLRQNAASDQKVVPGPAVTAATIQILPVRGQERVQVAPSRDPGWRALFQEDQFEFLSVEKRGALLRSVAS